ncbi:hypothetical protein CR513_61010, partial [Mucuna pruriens]
MKNKRKRGPEETYRNTEIDKEWIFIAKREKSKKEFCFHLCTDLNLEFKEVTSFSDYLNKFQGILYQT